MKGEDDDDYGGDEDENENGACDENEVECQHVHVLDT